MSREPRRIFHGRDAREGIVRGALKIVKAVRVTYGPCGRTVLLERTAGRLATKDGATIVRELSFSNRLENLGAEAIKQPSLAMCDSVGDGTTTVAILAGELLYQCERMLVAGHAPSKMVRGIRKAADAALELFQDISVPVTSEEEIMAVAMVSSNRDREISRLLTQAVMAVGKDGSISVEDGRGVESELLIRDGMELPSGFANIYLSDAEDGRTSFEQPLVALFDCGLHTYGEMKSVVETASQWPHNPLLLVGHHFEGETMAVWGINSRVRGSYRWTMVKTPGTGNRKRGWLDDLAALSGAVVFDAKAGMDSRNWDPEWFGSVQTVVVERNKTLLVGYDNEESQERVRERVAALKIAQESTQSDWERDRIRERIARLDGGFCVLRVGGTTETELKERRARIEDTLGSLRAALESGILPGGGSSMLNAADWLDYLLQENPLEDSDERVGWQCFSRALRGPFKALVANSGQEPSEVFRRLDKDREKYEDDLWVGWDALSDDVRLLYEDPMVIDASKVVHDSVRYAVSAVSTIIMTNAAVVRTT